MLAFLTSKFTSLLMFQGTIPSFMLEIPSICPTAQTGLSYAYRASIEARLLGLTALLASAFGPSIQVASMIGAPAAGTIHALGLYPLEMHTGALHTTRCSDRPWVVGINRVALMLQSRLTLPRLGCQHVCHACNPCVTQLSSSLKRNTAACQLTPLPDAPVSPT